MNSIKEKFDEFISHMGLSSGSGRAVRMRKEDPELSESSFLF